MESSTLVETLLAAPYGSSFGKMQRIEKSIRGRRELMRSKEESADRYYSLLYKLKRDGLIEERSASGGGAILALTARGVKRQAMLSTRQRNQHPQPCYESAAAERMTIVAFDIPEIERRKRAWLRGALLSIGLRMVQKSLWMGKKKVPKEFLQHLAEMRLIEYVEIFEITKVGSLHQIA